MRTRGLVTMLRNRANREEIYSRPEYWNTKAAEDKSVGMWPNPHLNDLYHREQMEWFARETAGCDPPTGA